MYFIGRHAAIRVVLSMEISDRVHGRLVDFDKSGSHNTFVLCGLWMCCIAGFGPQCGRGLQQTGTAFLIESAKPEGGYLPYFGARCKVNGFNDIWFIRYMREGLGRVYNGRTIALEIETVSWDCNGDSPPRGQKGCTFGQLQTENGSGFWFKAGMVCSASTLSQRATCLVPNSKSRTRMPITHL